jgi:PAS domain S-box-containing protein
MEEKLQRLNLVLRTVRKVNQLLVKEKDRGRLIQGICDNLVENRGYYNAWIALFDGSGTLVATAEAGLGEEFMPMLERLKRGDLTECGQRALSQPGVALIEDPVTACVDCPLSRNYAGRGAMTARLEHESKVYGLLSVSVPRKFALDEEEQVLLQEVAGDIAFGLYRIELEKEQERASAALEERTHELGERVKELNCLYAISELTEKPDISLEEVLQGTIEHIPPAWQYPEIICARLILDDQEFKTTNFKKTQWKQESGIFVLGEPRGTIEVYYLEEKAARDEGPFTKEERKLIDAISERVGKIIERQWIESALRKSEKRFRDLIENSVTGISIVQDNRIVYQNPEQERLLGPLPRKFRLADLDGIHPEDVEKVKEFHQKIISGKDQILDADFRFYPVDDAGSKGEMRWVYCRASLIEYQGEEAILVNMMDVTRAKGLESLLRIQDKMTSLGRVAAGIAHEIRNPLSGINMYLNALEKIYDREESLDKVRGILDQLQSASNKIESVVRRVMDFSKPSAPKFVSMDINRPIEEAIKLSSVTLRKSGVKIETSLAEGLPRCKVDPNMIEQVILNLITNAAEAMKSMEEAKRLGISSSMEKYRILVKISDSGPGVPLPLKDKVFDPFYTTKNSSTGIGLSLTHRIIMDHGGSLDVRTSKWGGAEFVLEIPIEQEI